VLALFLMEGALVGLVGGLLGLALARGVAYPSDAYFGRMVEQRLNIKLTGSLFAFPWWLMVGAPALAAVLATLAAYYPPPPGRPHRPGEGAAARVKEGIEPQSHREHRAEKA
jgi:ABC-type lipoprotein release transport system permease subunit